MKLQAALDYLSIDEALGALGEVARFVDIAEIGTPLLLSCGADAVRRVREAFPALEVFADAKIMDGGEIEADMLYRSGADFVSVMGITNDATVMGVARAARVAGRRFMADMMLVRDLPERARELVEMGAGILCVHTAYDVRGAQASPLSELRALKSFSGHTALAIAGGVNAKNIADVSRAGADIAVVGGAITAAPDRAAAAEELRELMEAEG
ncbi:MAG: orotidine 5'-phosphate decarboxylase [Synergistaceae bacterium]|jgi:3-hexulose-6-phosphate synthase|nr:orotidine 5'-phosphate decarboxylase [Synergistaceae bacterium]